MTSKVLHDDGAAAWLRRAQRATRNLVAYVTANPDGDPLDGRKLGALLAAGADPNVKCTANWLCNPHTNALQLVVRHRGTKDLELMLAAGASVADDVCLMIAVRRSLERVRMLLAAGAKPSGKTLMAALGGDRDESRGEETEIIEALLEAGADPNELRRECGILTLDGFVKRSLLEWAFVTGRWREHTLGTIRALLGKGVGKGSGVQHGSGVFCALSFFDDLTNEQADKAVIVTQLLLDAGMDCNATISNASIAQGTPLMAICRGERHEELRRRVVRLLLDAGANPNVHGVVSGRLVSYLSPDYLSTPLLLAAQVGHATIVQELLDGGADPRLVPDMDSAYDLAVQAGHAAVAALLAPLM